MPTYRYRCLSCKMPFELAMRYQDYGVIPVKCTHCGNENVERRIERIRVLKDDAVRLQNMADPQNLANIEDDPRALGKMMRNMESQIGENMGSEFDEVVGRLESGQSAQNIERELPDLAEE
ncbi:MAG: zinc ribbon domain-containing protein [Anaerolineaceae bacterium]|nr:zinc ribbon domain-containing protein [Anaerolineaceae bacterium]